MPADGVSVVVTNYNTGPYLERCVQSLVAQDLGGLRLEVVVVENASPRDQERHLRAVEAAGARVLRLPHNLGHGGGCNRGLALTSGATVFFVNSDTVACPGALRLLVDTLQARPDAGLVEPRTYFDDDRAFCIPEVPTPSPSAALLALLAQRSPRLARLVSIGRTRRSHRGWTARAPLPVSHLTGAFLGARREVVQRLGGYDEGYPLYYEDSDLFARTRRLGLRLLLVPGADVIHYTHRSVVQDWEASQAKARIGRARYMRLHGGWPRRWFDRWIERAAAKRAPTGMQPPPADLGTLTQAPTFTVDAHGPWVLELAFDPHCALSAGRLCAEASVTLSPATWASLYPTTYFARALEVARWRVLGAWRFVKG